jgi:ABC-type multidrug transport system ATPase subunit
LGSSNKFQAPNSQLQAPTRNHVLDVKNLRKVYGHDIVAVDLVSFHVGRNEIVGLLGPNGAGKTTTINMVLGVLTPSSGSIVIDGIDIARDRQRALERTNFAAVYAALPGNLTVVQNLRIFHACRAGKGIPQQPYPAAARRADGVARSGSSRRRTPADSQVRGGSERRHPVDVAQHV